LRLVVHCQKFYDFLLDYFGGGIFVFILNWINWGILKNFILICKTAVVKLIPAYSLQGLLFVIEQLALKFYAKAN
jgi:hypothetical protein